MASSESEAEVRAAQEAAHQRAKEHQQQGQGRAVPEGDAHPLTPGNNGRRTT